MEFRDSAHLAARCVDAVTLASVERWVLMRSWLRLFDGSARLAASGTVDSVSVITDRDTGQSKGFAFVEMASDREAQAATEAMNGQMLDGRQIKVNEAKPKTSGGGGGGRGGYGGGGGGYGRRY